jgi:hypothetical protein
MHNQGILINSVGNFFLFQGWHIFRVALPVRQSLQQGFSTFLVRGTPKKQTKFGGTHNQLKMTI